MYIILVGFFAVVIVPILATLMLSVTTCSVNPNSSCEVKRPKIEDYLDMTIPHSKSIYNKVQ